MAEAGFRLALAQSPGALKTPEERLNWLAAQIPDVVGRGGDLLLLPELFTCGYNIGSALADRAEPPDGPTMRAVGALARQHRLAIACGYAERAGDHVFNSAIFLGSDGVELGHHRKLVLPPGFEHDHFTPGKGVMSFQWRGVTVAMLICYDAEFPESVRFAANLGAELVLVPTALGADWDWVATTMIPTRAFENGIYLAYANHSGSEGDLTYLGKSVIAAPDGSEAARAGSGVEVLLTDIDPSRVRSAQGHLPYLHDLKTLRL
mgnify:FL=1